MQKTIFTICVCSLCLFIMGCASTKPVISDTSVSTTETRDAVSEIQGQQANSAAAAQRVTDKSTDIAKQSADIAAGIGEAAGTLANGTDYDAEFVKLCEQIRKQSADTTATSGGDTAAIQQRKAEVSENKESA